MLHKMYFYWLSQPRVFNLGSTDGLEGVLELEGTTTTKNISIFTIGKLKFSISLSYEYQIDLLLELLFHALIQTYIYYCITI